MSTPATSVSADIEGRLKALETKAAADESAVWTWLKTNWAHFVTWAGVAYSLYKHL